MDAIWHALNKGGVNGACGGAVAAWVLRPVPQANGHDGAVVGGKIATNLPIIAAQALIAKARAIATLQE